MPVPYIATAVKNRGKNLMPQNAIRTTLEASAGTGSAFIATGGLSPSPCAPPTFSDYPLFYLADTYAFTVDDGFRLFAWVATVITISYFVKKWRDKH